MLESLNSNHTRKHVLAELNAYADLVSVDSFRIAFDMVAENLTAWSFPDPTMGSRQQSQKRHA